MQRLQQAFAAAPFGRNGNHPQHPQHPHMNQIHQTHEIRNPSFHRQHNTPSSSTSLPLGIPVSWSFGVPLNNTLPGPETSLAIYSSPGAIQKWSHPEGSPEDAPMHSLPVHAQQTTDLKTFCDSLYTRTGVKAAVTTGQAQPMTPVSSLQPTPTDNVITTVHLQGPSFDIVKRVREIILNSTPITMQCSSVPVDRHLLFKNDQGKLPQPMVTRLNKIADTTKADIFLLDPEERNEDGSSKTNTKEQLRFVVYGDMLTNSNAKMQILIMIDQMLGMHYETLDIELMLHSLICGRSRKKIKAVESATDTAIYFPPIFPHVHTYCPEGAIRRPETEIVVTGPDPERIYHAKKQLTDLASQAKAFQKDVRITPTKMDHLLLDRLDKLQAIMEAHASHIILPSIGLNNGQMRVNGLDVLNVERTARDVMALTAQFYSAEWQCSPGIQFTEAQIQSLLSDICAISGADVLFAGNTFYAYGSDEACKSALELISHIPPVQHSQSNIHIKLELAVEHKEFVSGKKNGKINKIMNLANVQIVFDGFNEYNFYIDVRGNDYKPTTYGLSLVEMELPASLSFHVPDQYHKRIIGIGGQHIQQLMKKYSVFVKFSNAHDRGPVMGKEDESLKLDNVICRTPSRNAQNLELVKQEIMDMVNRPDAEQVTENVTIDRLLHRELIGSHMPAIEDLEKKWNCKVTFPSTEQASDVVLISGPEFQVPNATYDLLALVPESHEVTFIAKTELKEYLNSSEFDVEVIQKLRECHVVELARKEPSTPTSEEHDPDSVTLVLEYTRNDSGGLKDAIDFLINKLMSKGLDTTTVKGRIARPISDTFENSLPFFESRLLHSADPFKGTDSPTRSAFGENETTSSVGRASLTSRFRKPNGMFSLSWMPNRHRHGTNSSDAPFFKHASSNASKASLASIDSVGSFRNLWNDSGINLTEEDGATNIHFRNGQTWTSTPNTITPAHHTTGHGLGGSPAHPAFPFSNNSSTSLQLQMSNGGISTPGDQTPTSRFDPRASVEHGRPATSHSLSGYPGHIGHHR